MTHVISITSTRFDRMSPTAAALAVLLHVATAFALWWVSPLNHRGVDVDIKDQAIDVTIERPQPEQPKPAPPATPAPEPRAAPPPPAAAAPPPAPPKATPVPLGLPPASPTTADTTKQAGPSTGQQRQAPDPQPQPSTPAEPQKPSSEPQQATAVEKVAPPVPLERSLPPIDAPPPPTSKDIPKALPPPPKAHAAPAPPKQMLRPSPLSRPAPNKPNDAPAAAPSVTFVNPADQYDQARLVDQYLSAVANKIAQYRYRSNQANEQGVVVLRMVISRNGRLVDVSVARSSGIINLDRGLIEAARAAAPFAPLPGGLPGPQIAFSVPFTSVYRR